MEARDPGALEVAPPCLEKPVAPRAAVDGLMAKHCHRMKNSINFIPCSFLSLFLCFLLPCSSRLGRCREFWIFVLSSDGCLVALCFCDEKQI